MLYLIVAAISLPIAVVLMMVLVATSKTVSNYVREVSRGEVFLLCWVVAFAVIALVVGPHV